MWAEALNGDMTVAKQLKFLIIALRMALRDPSSVGQQSLAIMLGAGDFPAHKAHQ